MTKKEQIAKRVAAFFKRGDLVNLGVGLPSMVASFLPEDAGVWILADNGMIGGVPVSGDEEADPLIRDAGNQLCRLMPGGCFLSSTDSFGLVRGGHLELYGPGCDAGG